MEVPGGDRGGPPPLESSLLLPLASEHRVVSVLFADIVGATALQNRLGDEASLELLDPAITEMVAGVTDFGGTVLKALGDGIMAVFGAPVGQEDHALRAVCAGLAVRDRIVQAAITGPEGPLKVRIGVHSGPVIFRARTARTHGQDTMGGVVSIAHKIEKAAPHNAVALSQTTADLLLGRIELAPAGDVTIGDSAITLYTAEAISSDSVLAQSFVRRRLTPLAGRSEALDRLSRFIAQAVRGEAPVLGLVSEAGFGKTRLAYEATVLAARRELPVDEMRGLSVEQTTPYAALRSYLRRFFPQPDGEAALAIAEATGTLGLGEGDAQALRAILTGEDGPAEWSGLSPGERRSAIVTGFIRFLLALARQTPFLLVVDDLQFFDAESRLCLQLLIASDDAGRPAILITTRPEQCAFLDTVAAAWIELARLRDDEARRLVQANARLVEEGTLAPDMVDEIVGRADGHPLILEELTKAALSPAPADRTEDALPLTVQTILQARLSALSRPALNLAATASAIGRQCSVDLLQRASGYEDEPFESLVGELVREQIMRMGSSQELRFRHQLQQEACYGLVLARKRMQLHERIYDALKEGADTNVTDQTLSIHAEKAGNLRGALDHLRDACLDSIRDDAIETAAQLFRHAFRILDALTQEDEARRAEFVLMAFDPFQQLARQGELIEPLQQVRDICRTRGEQRKYVQATTHLAAAQWISGRHKQALALAREGARLSGGTKDLPMATYAQFILANTEFACGEPWRAVARLDRLAAGLSGALGKARFGAISIMGVMSRAFCIWYLSDLGRFDEADRKVAEAEAIIADIQHEYSRLLIQVGRGYSALRRGDADTAQTALTAARRMALDGSFHGLEPSITGWLGAALVELGEPERGLDFTTATLASDRIERVLNHGNYCVRESHGRALAALGDLEAGLQMVEDAIAVARRNFDPISYAYGLHQRARLRRDGEDEGWRGDARAARRLAERIGLVPLWQALQRDGMLTLPTESA